MHTLIRALKTDLSCMSVRLKRLEARLVRESFARKLVPKNVHHPGLAGASEM